MSFEGKYPSSCGYLKESSLYFYPQVILQVLRKVIILTIIYVFLYNEPANQGNYLADEKLRLVDGLSHLKF